MVWYWERATMNALIQRCLIDVPLTTDRNLIKNVGVQQTMWCPIRLTHRVRTKHCPTPLRDNNIFRRVTLTAIKPQTQRITGSYRFTSGDRCYRVIPQKITLFSYVQHHNIYCNMPTCNRAACKTPRTRQGFLKKRHQRALRLDNTIKLADKVQNGQNAIARSS